MPTVSKQNSNSREMQQKLSVIDRMSNMVLKKDNVLKMLVYGKSGSGKTTIAGTFPPPFLWILCGGGKKSGETKSICTPEMVKAGVTECVIHDSAEIKEVSDWVAAGGTKLDRPYRTVVLDHVGGLQDRVLAEILGMERAPMQLSFGVARREQWGQVALNCKELLFDLVSLDCNVVVIAQERVFNSKEDVGDASDVIRPTVGPGVTPGLADWLQQSVDYVVQAYKQGRFKMEVTEVGEGKDAEKIETVTPLKGGDFYLRTGIDATYATKFRMPRGRVLPDNVKNPTHAKIMQIINGTYGNDKPATKTTNGGKTLGNK